VLAPLFDTDLDMELGMESEYLNFDFIKETLQGISYLKKKLINFQDFLLEVLKLTAPHCASYIFVFP
jgi:hypothetical protein